MRLFKNIKKIEIYKFGIISPVLHGSEEKQNEYFARLAEKGVIIPPGSENVFFLKPATFKGWLRKYRQHGLDGLKEQERCDKGKLRKIDPGLSGTIKQVVLDWQLTTIKSIWRKLIECRYLQEDSLSYESVRRYIKRNRLLIPEKKARKKFEKALPNELWMVDFKHGRTIRCGRGYKKAHLCAIIDDATRMVVGYKWGFYEDTALFSSALRQAIAVFGIPNILYCDCGKVFQSQYAMQVCGRLGTSLINTEPYSPESKGKIEKFNLTVQQLFYPMVKDFRSLKIDDLNKLFSQFIQEVYHKREHASLNESPLGKLHRLLPETKIRRPNDEELKQNFLCSMKRRVRNDATVRIDNTYYEVDIKLIGEQADIRFPIDRPTDLYLYDDEKMVGKLAPVNLVENANPPYISNTFSKLVNKGGQ